MALVVFWCVLYTLLKPNWAATLARPPLGSVCKPIGGGMPCKSCGSVNQKKFSAEMGIHFPGLENIDKPTVWVFPEVIVCLDCGNAEFAVPEEELRQLEQSDSAAAGYVT